jgi:hypothetical protein
MKSHSVEGKVTKESKPKETWMKSPVAEFLMNRNKEQSEEFVRKASEREEYLRQHPTEFMAYKCMDGRVHLPIMTKTLPGIIKPFRNLGAKFRMGWPYLGALSERQIFSANDDWRPCIPFSTYHFSVGSSKRGCAAFGNNTELAIAAATKLHEDFEYMFEGWQSRVYPIMVGVETDLEALVLHGKDGPPLNMAEPGLAKGDLIARLEKMYPDMPGVIRKDLQRLLIGNLEHINDVREQNKTPADLEHKEQVLAFGRGFDWLHWPNKALIVGPY